MRKPLWLWSVPLVALVGAGAAAAQEPAKTDDTLQKEIDSLKRRDQEKDQVIRELQESMKKLQELMQTRNSGQLHEADAVPLSQEVEKYNQKMERSLPILTRDGEPLSEAIKALRLSMQVRVRGEYVNNLTDFDHHRDDEFFFAPYRFRLGVGADITEELSVYAEAQSVGHAGDQPTGTSDLGSAVVNSNQDNDLEFYQGYVTWMNFLNDEYTSLIAGRQEMTYGTEFLVGNNDFYHGLSFDGVRVRRSTSDYDASAFATQIVNNDFPAVFTPAGTADENVNFYGTYFTLKTIECAQLDLYWLWFQDHSSPLQDDRHTFGARLGGTFGDGYFDYNAEYAQQFGDGEVFGGPAGNQDLDIVHAYGFEAWLGYTFKDVDWTPWLAVKYARASGDDDPTNGNINSFNPLFQDLHNRYGNADLIGFTNVNVYGLMARIQPCEGWTWGANYWYYTVVEQEDPLGPVSGLSTGQGGSHTAGQEFDLYVDYAIAKYASLGISYSHFLSGEWIEDQLGFNPDGADRAYVNFNVHF